MQDYDAVLKLLLRQAGHQMVQVLTGVPIAKWLDIELPRTQNLRLDLLGEDSASNLYHFELQSTNDPRIHLRMAEYALGTFRLTGRFPLQVILAGLRQLGQTIKEEVRNMPLIIDIMENDLLGPAIRSGIEQGRQEGEQRLLRIQIEKRFGPLPAWASE